MNNLKTIAKFYDFDRVSDLAMKMNMLPNSLSSDFLYMTKHKKYETSFALKLFFALGVSKDDFKNCLENLDESAFFLRRLVQSRFDNFSEAAISDKEYVSLIKGLVKGDSFIRTGFTCPDEFKGLHLRREIVKAINRGVVFYYFYPSNSFENRILFDQLGDLTMLHLSEYYKSYKEFLLPNLVQDDKGNLVILGLDNFPFHPFQTFYLKRGTFNFILQEFFIGNGKPFVSKKIKIPASKQEQEFVSRSLDPYLSEVRGYSN